MQLPEDTDATRTEYTYDEMYRTASIAADTETGLSLSAEYTYEDDLLTAIETPTTTYTFEYGNFSLRSKVKIGNRNLASYTYENGTNRLIKLDYGNQDSVQYTYDDMGRLTKETYEDNQTVSYAYDNSGNLATVTDSETGIVTTYYYDLLNRLVGYREKSATLDHTVTYTYDAENNLSSMVETIDDVSKTYTYTYDEDNRLISMSVGGTTVTYTYDDFGRIRNRTVKNDDTVIHNNTVSYQETAETTSNQIVEYAGYSYAYDKNGNITYYGDGRRDENFYQYDSQNQLIRAESYELGYIWIWEYDNAGNILSRTKYDFFDTQLETALETVSYGYTDSEWGDLLTSYGDQNITYDTIGNPLSDGTWTYTWKHGRQLTSMFDETTTWNFTYNADGLRTQRTNGATTYTYVYNGSQLVRMTVDGLTYNFAYDASGTPLTVTVDGTVYYYITNLQGDVVAIKNENGYYVTAYYYDAWGNVTCDNIYPVVTHNPLLYRGYVYDMETGLYYLQSRYYNPEWGRFINADAISATGQGFVGNNMFAYCNNNPVNFYDEAGYAPEAVKDKIVHDMVLAYICSTNENLSWTDTCIYYNKSNFWGGWGFCDLYNKKTGEVWELKKVSNSYSCKTSTALAQLNGYINGRLKNNLKLKLCMPNKTQINPGSFSFEYLGYDYRVNYYSEGNGILRYSYTKTKTEARKAAEAVVAVAALATIIYLCPAAAPITVFAAA